MDGQIFIESLHPSIRAQLARERATDPETRSARIAPGSFEEAEALAAIDARRREEQGRRDDTPERRQARSERYWRRHVLD